MMIELLAKLLIKDRGNINDTRVRTEYGALCGVVGIIFNLILFVMKLITGTLTGSIAITADAFNNLSDGGSSLVSLVGIKLAGHKPDAGHPFGHGRLEYITGFIVSAIIIIMAYDLGKTSIGKIIHPEEITFGYTAIIILSVSILVKLYMFIYNSKYGKKTDSVVLIATAKDSLSDSVSTFAVLASMIISKVSGVNIDAYTGLLVALLILYTGISTAVKIISLLLGGKPSKELTDKVTEIVKAHSGVAGIHDLVIHDYGPGRQIVTLHAEVSANDNILHAHDMIDGIERELAEKLHCEALIHMDPILVDDEETVRLRDLTLGVLNVIDPDITMHDFRVVDGPTHTNLIFDIVVPYANKTPENQLKDRITAMLREKNNRYFTAIKIDRSFI